MAGVIGERKFAYDVWDHTVNIASRLESQGLPGRIHVSEQIVERLSDRFTFECRGEIEWHIGIFAPERNSDDGKFLPKRDWPVHGKSNVIAPNDDNPIIHAARVWRS